MRVLVCGSRHWDDEGAINHILNWYRALFSWEDLVLIEGGAKGADALAAKWAGSMTCQHEQYPADWDKHGKAAGPIRNQQMLDEGKPDVVWAFKDHFNWSAVPMTIPGGGGTEDMVRRAKLVGIPCYVVSRA